MSKAKKITYWIATIWLCFGMAFTAVIQLMQTKEEVMLMDSLKYPAYLLTIIGVWKLLGVIAVLIPKTPLLKEWAYAGFFFCMSGALLSHIAVSHSFGETAPPVLLLVLTVLSWYLRPADRKVATANA